MSNHRVLYTSDRVYAMCSRMRSDLHELRLKHLREMADLRRELDETRAAFDDLRAAVLARRRAEQELADLRRQRSLAQAWAGERDPTAPLN